MAKLAFCKRCNATYPLNIVVNDGGRSGKVKEPACPMGHTEVKEAGLHPQAAWQEVTGATPSRWSSRPPWWWPTS